MIKITPFGPVIRFDLGRSLAGRGFYWTTAYLVDDLLVDSGCAHSSSELARALLDFRLARIINTHTHEDHIGANGLLQSRQPDLEILVHPLGLPILADPRGQQPLHPYRRLFWGWPQPSRALPLSDGVEVQSGQHCYQVIYTPGHSQDHLCLYEPREGWLFSGDLFVGGRDRALRSGTNIRQVIAGLKRLAALPAKWIFPGSARVREDPIMELAGKIAYLEKLGERVIEYHRQGRSEREIVRAVCGGPMWIELLTLGHFTRRELVRSYLAAETG